MGRLNDQDPASTHATTRSRHGIARETQIFRTSHCPHLQEVRANVE